MSLTRREFVKDIVTVGVTFTVGGKCVAGDTAEDVKHAEVNVDRCPYFDQPMHCRCLNKKGKHLCEDE